MKRKIIPFAAVTAAMVLSMSVEPVSAYFTDHHEADGHVPVRVEPTTEIKEKFGDRKKTVSISNTGDPAKGDPAVFVRMKVFSSQPVKVESAAGTWATTPDADGFYECSKLVEPGQSSDDVTVTLDFPKNATEDDEYNVIVTYESTPVRYRADGTPYADWSHILDRVQNAQSNQS